MMYNDKCIQMLHHTSQIYRKYHIITLLGANSNISHQSTFEGDMMIVPFFG